MIRVILFLLAAASLYGADASVNEVPNALKAGTAHNANSEVKASPMDNGSAIPAESDKQTSTRIYC